MVSGGTPTVGESYSLTCTVTGAVRLYPTIAYQWFKNNTEVSGETQSTLSFSSLSLSDAGQYRCDVTVGSALLNRDIANSSNPIQLVIPSKLVYAYKIWYAFLRLLFLLFPLTRCFISNSNEWDT